MEETKFRNKVCWFQFVCCVMVIWNHAGNAELFLGPLISTYPLKYMQEVTVVRLIRVSIPCFMMISGYQFFRNFTMDKLAGKWKRRVKSLLIPYLVWNFLYYVGYLLAGQIEYNPELWFMYQQILLVILAPVLYVILKRVWSGGLFLLILLLGIYKEVALPQLNLDALFYFSAAAFCGLHWKRFVEGRWNVDRFLVGLFLTVSGGFVIRFYYTHALVAAIVLGQAMVSAGAWLMVGEGHLPGARPFMTCTFFIYAFHFIPVRFINKLAASWWQGSETAASVIYFAMPLFAVFICGILAWGMRRWTPGVWKLLNGGS